MSRAAGILLIDPKYPHDVGGVLRAAAILGPELVRWSGGRVPPSPRWPEANVSSREERLTDYKLVDFARTPELSPEVVNAIAQGYDLTPVEIEVRKNAEALPEFTRPERPTSISDASRLSRFRL